LNAKQLQGIFPVAIRDVVLQFAESGDLASDLPGISDDGGESNDKAENQARRWRAVRSRGARHEIEDTSSDGENWSGCPLMEIVLDHDVALFAAAHVENERLAVWAESQPKRKAFERG
jgi:hypothetical protein